MSTGAVASNELHLVLNASGDAAAVLRKMAGEIDKTQKGAAGSARQMNKMATSGKRAQKSWTEFAAKWGTITAGFYAASRAVGMVVDGLESGGRAIALNNRIESLAGGTLKVEAAMRGLLGTMNETDTQGLVILMDQIGMTSEQIEIATRYALGYAEAMGKELGPTLERVTQAFASGRATSFRALGIDAANAAEAIQKMDAAGRGLVEGMDKTSVAIKQARTAWENFVSGVEVGSVRFAAALIDSENRINYFASDVLKEAQTQAQRTAAAFAESKGLTAELAAEYANLLVRIENQKDGWVGLNEKLEETKEGFEFYIDNKASLDAFWASTTKGIDSAADAAADAIVKFSGLGAVIGLLSGEPDPNVDMAQQIRDVAAAAQSRARAAAWAADDAPTPRRRGPKKSGPDYDAMLLAGVPKDGPRAFGAIGALGATLATDDPSSALAIGPALDADSYVVEAAVDRTLEAVNMLTDGFAYSARQIGGTAGAISLAMSSAVGAIGDKNGASAAIKVAGGLASGVTGAMASMAWAMVPFEIAQSAAAFATGNIPGGIQHAFAAVNYGIAAGRGKQSGGSSSGSASSSGAAFSAGTDFGTDRASNADQSPTYIYYVQTGGGDIVAGDTSSESWLLGRLESAGARGETISPDLTRRAGRGNSFGGM